MKKCNHDFNDNQNTLEILSKRELVFPQVFYFQCKNCKKIYKGLKKEGIFEEFSPISF